MPDEQPGLLSAEERARRRRVALLVVPLILLGELVIAGVSAVIGWRVSGSVGWGIVSAILASLAFVVIGGAVSVAAGGPFLPHPRARDSD